LPPGLPEGDGEAGKGEAMKTNAEALGAITAMIVGFVLVLVVIAGIFFGTAVLAGLWLRIFLEVAL
jgi:hypothetical protein